MKKEIPPKKKTDNPADTHQSVWVAASAGTGKTYVLTQRILRLLLDGARPEKLLCITFTKAAAAEVMERVQDIVKEWSILPEDKLHEALREILKRNPDKVEIAIARRLLPEILQAPGGVRIQTIHAFCQSVLARFPIESGIPAGFRVADEAESFALLHEAKQNLFRNFDPQSPLGRALGHLYGIYKDDSQNTLLNGIVAKRYRLNRFIRERGGDLHGVGEYLSTVLGTKDLDVLQPENEILRNISKDTIARVADILNATESSKNHATAEKLLNDDFLGAFLTTEDEFRKSFYYSFKNNPPEALVNFFERGVKNIENYIAAATHKDTMALLTVAKAVLDEFDAIKKRRGVMDYEDQILKTVALLTDLADGEWVLYKLDNGIDHILVDEAQDTSPAQWDIVEKLSDEFFAGNGRKDINDRTLFVVGDEKQSIFSFQNADPEEFYRMRQLLEQKAKSAGSLFADIPQIENRRSSPLILKLVDECFADENLRRHLSRTAQTITHKAHYKDKPGEIAVWPLEPKPDKDDKSYHASAEYRLAKKIVDHAESLIRDKKVPPGDIMVLVRTRSGIVTPLTKLFKDRNIPVLGADRLVMKDQLGVQDCLAALELTYHPQDDTLLACFLKSPFIDMAERDLHDLCVGAGSSLWERLSRAPRHAEIFDYLEKLASTARKQGVAAFLSQLLNTPCPADDHSGRRAMIRRLGYECNDILNELIGKAQSFETDHLNDAPHFVTWVRHNDHVYKEQSHDVDKSRLRIMTVHASKGLQAPHVILADAHSCLAHYNSSRDVLWSNDIRNGLMWTATKPHHPAIVSLKAAREEFSHGEYYRLLYVALTRAENSLVICGVESKASHPTWYDIAQRAITAMGATDGTLSFGTHTPNDNEKTTIARKPIPAWMFEPPKDEPATIRPLRPSQAPVSEPAASSPLKQTKTDLYQRGIALHHVFRVVPEHPLEQQDTIIDKILSQYGDIDRDGLKREALTVFRHPDFSFLFTPQARAEVPLVGEVEIDEKKYAVSGQVDRLLVTPERVIVVDYKTNRPPARDETDVSEAYRHQLRVYKILLEQIYPGQQIDCALLWTANAYLLPVSV